MLVPFEGHVVRPEWAERVVSPAYDGVNATERRKMMDENPYVFLHVTRSPEDVAEGSPRDPGALADSSATALQRLLDADAYESYGPAVYLYRLRLGDHLQTAVVADVPVAIADEGRLRPHERTRAARASLLGHHLERVRVSSSPIAVTYREHPGVDDIVETVTAGPPILAFSDASGLEQTVWRVADPALIANLDDAIGDAVLYITDGHHRTAAAVAARNALAAAGTLAEDHPARFMLCALFPAAQLQVYPFHRMVTVDGAPADAVAALAAAGALTAADGPVAGSGARTFGVHAAGHWWRLDVDARGDDGGALPADVLQDRVLRPVFGIDDPGASDRIEYLPGTAGLDTLAERCGLTGTVGFALEATGVDTLMDVVDAGRVLPPKSTFFHPKPRSGIFLRLR
ncbi:MAG: DUF1015 family protein [Acidimicrobiales bacterium]